MSIFYGKPVCDFNYHDIDISEEEFEAGYVQTSWRQADENGPIQEVYLWRRKTQEEIERKVIEDEWTNAFNWSVFHGRENIELVSDAIADMSEIVSENFETIDEYAEAIAEMSQLISDIYERLEA